MGASRYVVRSTSSDEHLKWIDERLSEKSISDKERRGLLIKKYKVGRKAQTMSSPHRWPGLLVRRTSAKIDIGLQKQPPRLKSSTYRVLGIMALAIALIAEVGIILILRPSLGGLLWNLAGVVLSFALFFGVLYGEVAYPKGSSGGGLVALAYITVGILLLYLIRSASKRDPEVGDLLVASCFVGWGLGWGLFSVPIFRAKKRVELTEPIQPPESRVSWRRDSPILSPSGVVPAASLCIVTSAGIMLWMAFELLVYPEYGGGIMTLRGWLNGSVVALPNIAAILMMVHGWRRQKIRYLMLAATLSGFSPAAPLSVLAEIALWRAHRKFGLPW